MNDDDSRPTVEPEITVAALICSIAWYHTRYCTVYCTLPDYRSSPSLEDRTESHTDLTPMTLCPSLTKKFRTVMKDEVPFFLSLEYRKLGLGLSTSNVTQG